MSIRLKLTFFYSAIMAMTLLVLGTALYMSVGRWLALQLDWQLSKQAQEVVDASPKWFDRASGQVSVVPQVDAFAGNDMFIQIIDATGHVRARSENLSNHIMPVSKDVLDQTAQRYTIYEDVTLQGKLLRLYSQPFIFAGQPAPILVVQVGTMLGDQYEALVILQKLLLLGGLLSLLIAFYLGWLMAGVALQPIGRIAQTAGEIGASGDWSRRVFHTGPCDEVGQLANTFNAMLEQVQAATDRLEDSLRQQRRFVADASHELRTPLTSIRSNVGLLRRVANISPDDRSAALADIDTEAARMSRLVSDLLALARADAGRHRRHEPVALRPLIRDAGRQAQALNANVALTVETSADASVCGDADGLKQLVLILLDNALKFTAPGGRVTLRLDTDADLLIPGTNARITVSDTGTGIAAESLPHIFDRFYRADTARSGTGSGLGLAIARAIVHEHNGAIEVQSTPGSGSTFTVTLPLLAAGAPAANAPVAPAAAELLLADPLGVVVTKP